MLDMSSLFTTVQNPTTISITYSICLSFVLSSLIAMTYQRTYQGLSYSRNYVQALILASIVATVAMQAIGDNLARGLGMMGALAMIRFRNNMRDPRDMIFVFMSLAVGIACGVYAFTIAALGTIGYSIFAMIVSTMPFSKEDYFDGILRFSLDNTAEEKRQLEEVMSKHCQHYSLVSLAEASKGKRLAYNYQIKLKNDITHDQLMGGLQEISSMKGLRFSTQELMVELNKKKSKNKNKDKGPNETAPTS
ncbi:MAG: DUF4956 domain-containing protein [Halobacteriovoraceae bacterium]|nr:DUF4956 domain-containing protein [Halobacteriovoraceae bacterium]|tara:strand:+ start:5633 stop:6379 length:747 start_codon:yes stop_codon:yes gene_type:complete